MATLKTGSRIGVDEVLAPIGAGGMGEVYRSRDTKLKREVAIKVLPAEFSREPESLRRFRREAEVLATLNHSHVAQIYGLEEMGDTLCLVLELVEGGTLQDLIKRGPIPTGEVLELARQIAEPLEAAHAREIVHRDLKPANIKITPDGHMKVLDFGLAKQVLDWSADGRWILFTTQSSQSGLDLWALPLQGERRLIAVAQTAFQETAGRFSPDAHWISYQSNESGRSEVYIQPFPDPGARSQISVGGGTAPQWRRDGKELFYLGSNNHLMSVAISLNGANAEPSTPKDLFPMSTSTTYTASSDGQRFLLNEIVERAVPNYHPAELETVAEMNQAHFGGRERFSN